MKWILTTQAINVLFIMTAAIIGGVMLSLAVAPGIFTPLHRDRFDDAGLGLANRQLDLAQYSSMMTRFGQNPPDHLTVLLSRGSRLAACCPLTIGSP